MLDWVLVVADIRELEHPVWRSMGWRWCDGVWAVSSADWVLAVAVLRESEHPVDGGRLANGRQQWFSSHTDE